jgi:HD-like signal output (HDOD) protein
MELVIGVGLVLIAMAVAWPWWRRARPQNAAARVPTPTVPVVARPVPRAPDVALVWPDFRPQRAHDLPPERQRQLLASLVAVPRPSRLLDQLLSPEFINQASARQLAELVAGEPLLAARVLKAVNAPFYGLPQPVNSITQAVTFLGVTTVRITCLRYIFIAAFKTSDAQRQLAIDRLWQASALATELMSRAAAPLQLADAGRWSSAVLLSFLGRLAVLASAQPERLPALCDGSPVQRIEAEQQLMGLCAAELGRLLMADWGLPAAVVNDAVDIEWLLFDAPMGPADARGEALALCALCVRLSERATAPATGADGLAWDFDTDPAHDMACLRVRMGGARRAAVGAWLATPVVQQLVRGNAVSAP